MISSSLIPSSSPPPYVVFNDINIPINIKKFVNKAITSLNIKEKIIIPTPNIGPKTNLENLKNFANLNFISILSSNISMYLKAIIELKILWKSKTNKEE